VTVTFFDRVVNWQTQNDFAIELVERFKDWLDETYPPVTIGLSTFLASTILMDHPQDFRCSFVDWAGAITCPLFKLNYCYSMCCYWCLVCHVIKRLLLLSVFNF